MFIITLMTSVALTAIFCASSPTVMASPIATSRTTRSVGISNPCLASDSPPTERRLPSRDFFVLMTRLVLEHLALDVGAFAAHFDVHRARAPLGARQFQLGLRFAPQGNLAWSRICLHVVMTVAAPQMRQQLVLRVLADHVLCAVDLDPRLIELLQQPIDRDFQHLGELGDGNICHTCS